MSAGQRHPLPKGDRLKQLRGFCQAAQLGNISRAAESVMSSQPAVSSQIRALEDELGVQLFERRGPRITLTPMGEYLYRYAMPLVQGMDRLPDTFAEEHYGVMSDALTIGAGQTSAAFLLPRYLKRFRQRCPNARVGVRIGDGSLRLRWLRAGEADLILLAVDKPPRDLQFHELVESRFMLITPLDHSLVGRSSLKSSDIEDHPFIGHVSGRSVRQIGDFMMRQHGVDPDVAVEIDGWSVIKLYVEAGLGISVVPEICVTERDAVWSIPLDQFLPPRRYGVLARNDELLSLAARRFLEIIAEDPHGGSDVPDADGAQ